MSNTDRSNSQTASLPEFNCTSESFNYAFTHVFLPVKLPEESDYTLEKDLSLSRAVLVAAHAYSKHIRGTSGPQWHRIIRMLDNLQTSVQSEGLQRDLVVSQLSGMETGDILTFYVRPHDFAIILTKQENSVLFESFEVPPHEDAVKKTAGSLTCSYPGFAVEIPNETFNDGVFPCELADFFCRPNAASSDSPPSLAPHLQPVTPLRDILQGVSHTVDVRCIVKHVRDDARWSPILNVACMLGTANAGWRRSSLWLLLRVVIQMSLDHPPPGRTPYKEFMLFFICTIARDANITALSNDQLHLMGSKILRRLGKLGSSIPDWLSRMALETCVRLGEIRDARWTPPRTRSSPFRNPSQENLARDTELLLSNSREYICNVLLGHDRRSLCTPFHPSHRRRGTIDDFLSLNGAFFEEAYKIDPEVTLYDVEQTVEQGIDNWIACVTNVDEACAHIGILLDQYMKNAWRQYFTHAEDTSVMLLTGIELFVALDQLAVKEIPMLADYSPEVLEGLGRLLLRSKTSHHRLSRAYQYLSARRSRSRPGWSVLSDKFTEDSFAVRYYDQSPHLQQLKVRIEEDTMVTVDSQSPLPANPLLAKVVVFELQCPACVRIWRSAVAQISNGFLSYHPSLSCREEEDHLLSRAPALQPYFVDGPSLDVQICFVYFYPEESLAPSLHYALLLGSSLFEWDSADGYGVDLSYSLHHSECSSCTALTEYIKSTSHTSNDVLAAQADCPTDLSLDEFIAFGQLRSGGLLQWSNILRGLRSRTLNLRRCHVHFLLAHAILQVGPLGSNTGIWIWHQDLNDASFCNALLDELESLFMDVGANLIDGVLMGTISLLLTRVLASSPNEGVSERTIALLGRVRRKTFNWVQELSYNLTKAPMNKERSNLLLEMAAICRSTFDVDSAALRQLFRCAEDVDAAISGTLFIYALHPKAISDFHIDKTPYRGLLLQRDRRLSLSLEETLRDVVLADASDYGIDLGVEKIFFRHKPSEKRWKQLHHPNTRWLVCQTKATSGHPSKTVLLNLLDGQLRVDGQPLGVLPQAVRDDIECQEIFRDQGFFVIPSDLPGMDFTTQTTMSEYKVHFSLQGKSLVVRTRCNHSNDILELIHSNQLQGDLPPALVHGYIHWLNLSTHIIEIHPFQRPWERSPENWKINCTSGQYRGYKGRETLVDIRSQTWAMVSQCFKCLDISEYQSNNLLVTTLPTEPAPSRRLSAALLHFGLSFFVNDCGELESHDFKGMVYDENQSFGALYSLGNLLVFRHKNHLPEGLIPRRVLIPDGFLEHKNRQVQLCKAPAGCLMGDGSGTSTRFLAYAHAMTSCDRPDPLTGKKGIHEAYFLLQSAGGRSIMELKALDNSDEWISTQYPQINILHKEITERYYWHLSTNKDKQDLIKMLWNHLDWFPTFDMDSEKRAAGRAAYLFPWRTGTYSTFSPEDPSSRYISNEQEPWRVTLNRLLSDRPAPELPPRSTLLRGSHKKLRDGNPVSDGIPELNRLLSSLSMNKSNSSFQQEYIAHLHASAQCVREDSQTIHTFTKGILEKYYTECRMNYFNALDMLKKSLGPTTDPHQQALDQFGQRPPITADILLRCLASTSPISVPGRWKKCLISFALLLLEVQRSRRLLQFASDGLEAEFSEELDNEGCNGWNPEDYPDWLLVQIQGNFLIRRAQADIAMEMISPKSGRNTLMQVNMGEGKTSVIIPIVAAALSDGKQLSRIIVPKTSTVQMFELLVARLGGLANRPIYHLPFSRSTEYMFNHLHRIISKCVAEHGILLVQPEHVASLKLTAVEKQLGEGSLGFAPLLRSKVSMYKHIPTVSSLKSLAAESFVDNIFRRLRQPENNASKKDAPHTDGCGEHSSGDHDKHYEDAYNTPDSASRWLILQKWIDSHIRDILDESDAILHPRFQLVYTIGLERQMDGCPSRWTITQQILQRVRKRLHTSIGYQRGTPGSFPHAPIERSSDIGINLISWIVEDVMTGRLSGFRFQDVEPDVHDAIRSFISDEDILQVPDTAKRVEEYAEHSHQSYMWNALLLLRGLLASRILWFTLVEKRWRIDYGLASQSQQVVSQSRSSGCSQPPTMLAVPYRAKDEPALNTQFNHPDVTIILTCLSWYYRGLNQEELRVSFETLLDEDDPTTEYALWVDAYDDGSLPDSLRTLGEISTKSSEQWDKVIVPLFSRNQGTIDFYLSRVVFPREAKEFPWKISASSWDLAEKRDKVITGLSGTNDSRWLLPMSIAQRDLDQQQGINARVLAHLLQPENNFYMVTHNNGKQETTHELLKTIFKQQPEIRVLLDVGAQILDLSNLQVAKLWLDISRDAVGAICFNTVDELVVLTRNGTTMSMLSSPLSKQLDRCVVYLDHAHSRETDIKLPIGSRAAVTLGLKLTKDRLVQGCMRMRKLGRGHSVMFFAPPEVDLSIRALAGKADGNTPVTTVDILCWAIHETWVEIRDRAPYWAQQGINHKLKYDAWSRFCNSDLTAEQLSSVWIEPERKSLEDLYAPCEAKNAPSTLLALDSGIQQRCKYLGIVSFPSAQMEEEQEREVNREIEREREEEWLPPKAQPAKHSLHPDVVAFVMSGVIPPLHSGSVFRPVFTTLERSSATTCEADVWSPFILATADFCNTIKPESTYGTIDQYLRPVQWVLSSQKDHRQVLVLLSPFEANCLLPIIRTNEVVHLHLYAPRISQRMRSSDDFRLYSIPPLPSDWTPPWPLIDQLNVFAGQLYLRDYRAYLRLCHFLDIPTDKPGIDALPAVRWNKFNIPGSFEADDIRFTDSPLPSVMALLSIRNRWRPFGQTHMGKIQQGLSLREIDFD